MDGAALLLLVSSVGVAFGWQPMPDGSQRYEYVVQLDPELATTLADGQSIPIVGDIPEHVRPIGRIRLVVGREDVPRQRLVTQLKPATDGSEADTGVALAQYNQQPYGEPRYGAAPRQEAPPSADQNSGAAWNPYRAAQPTTQQDGGSSWNNEQDDPPITPTEGGPPSGQQLFGEASPGATSWNNGRSLESAAAEVAAAPIDRVGQGLQQAVDPLKRGIERLDSEVRGAADNLGDRTKSLVDELRQPFQQPQLPADARQPAVTNAPSAGNAWNEDAAANASNNPLRNGAAQSGATWNNQAAAPQQPSTQAPPFASSQAPPQQSPRAGTAWNDGPDGVVPTGPQTPSKGASPQSATGDPWAGVPDPRPRTGAGNASGIPSDVSGLATRPLPFGGVGADPAATGPQFPNLGVGVNQQPGAAPGPSTPSNTAAAPASTVAPATVGSSMLHQPADRPLDGVASQNVATTGPIASPANTNRFPNNPAAGPQTANPAAAAAATMPGLAINNPAAPTQRDNTVAVLAAWVLLSGSVAGNLYLFWSYLDVRQKYRALVRKTARAVGSRFSAA